MSWKKTAAVFMTALCISGGASAYDLQSIAKAHLPPAFTYQDIPEQQELKFHNFTYPYHMGQLSVMLQKSRKFAYGYIVTAIETVFPGIPDRKRMEKPFPHEPRLSG